MNLKTAALGTMITAGTMLGGCAKKEMPRAERIFEKAGKEMVSNLPAAKTNAELSKLMYKVDSVDFANKTVKTAQDSLKLKASEENMNRDRIVYMLELIKEAASKK